MEKNIYKNNELILGCTVEIKCIILAITAMAHNCPDDEVVSASYVKPEVFSHGWLSLIDWHLDSLRCDDNFLSAVRKRRDHFAEMVQELRFDEYYWVSVGIKNENNEEAAVYCLLAIDKDLKEVIITKGYDERMRLMACLGPGYESAYSYGIDLYNELLNKQRP
jgi:hypothetical protein